MFATGLNEQKNRIIILFYLIIKSLKLARLLQKKIQVCLKLLFNASEIIFECVAIIITCNYSVFTFFFHSGGKSDSKWQKMWNKGDERKNRKSCDNHRVIIHATITLNVVIGPCIEACSLRLIITKSIVSNGATKSEISNTNPSCIQMKMWMNIDEKLTQRSNNCVCANYQSIYWLYVMYILYSREYLVLF